MKTYFYPLYTNNKTSNPFSSKFVESLDNNGIAVINKERGSKIPFIDLILRGWSTDIYILNWIEEIASGKAKKFGLLPYILFCCFFHIQRLRGKKFIWVYHNIVSHHNETIYSKKIKTMMLKYSYLIITFSKEALNILQPQTDKKVLFYNHPINEDLLAIEPKTSSRTPDILIWGGISKYKGIVEFLQFLYGINKECDYDIYIVGKCTDTKYDQQIKSLCNNKIIYNNRSVEFDELKGLVANSRYVLFPYIGDSISSSGALIDTIIFKGNAIGPDKGAFKDLAKDGICFTYERYEDIIHLISHDVVVNYDDINNFVSKNLWCSFGESLYHEMSTLQKTI